MDESFLKASEKIGSNFNLIQGAGGNTSFKKDDSIFIKASGYKLKDSLKKDIFVKVNLVKLRESLKRNIKNPLDDTWDKSVGKRPSMETYMHAILSHKYIFHTHCLNTISLLVQNECQLKIAKIFSDFKYKIIKYKTPGLQLANEIKKVIKEEKPEIIFLSNHGLVVCADHIDKALDLTYFVSKKLDILIPEDNKENLQKLNQIASGTCFRPTKYKEAHNIAFSKNKIKIASNGSLYPDHVVFLGPRTFVVKTKKDLKQIPINKQIDQKLPLIIVPFAGILVPENISFEAEELVLALSKIVAKIPNNTKINYLSLNDESKLEKSSSENYRLSLTSRI